jgi:hypothetical protein
MKGILITAGAALLVAVPVATGLIGNTSFAQSVPVRVPSHAILVDDSNSEHATSTTEPDDKGGQRTHTTEPGDGKGGGQRTNNTTEPGDDKGGQRTTSAADPTRGTVGDSGSGKGQNGEQGGNSNRTGGTDDGSGHT